MTESTATTRMKPPKGGAVVRMYCTGLGDCFLLGFRGGNGRTSYILIDCGVWKGAPGATEWMRQIMTHIKEEVDGTGIDLLVATHQHWDHLSGFSQARTIFDEIQVKQVWLPWTENPEDGTALKMVEERRVAFRAAVAAVTGMRARFGPDDEMPDEPSALRSTVENLEAVLQFAGYTPAAAQELLAAGPSTEDLLEIVRKKVEKPSYIRPSLAPQSLDGLADVRIYPLGPPTNLKLLGRDNPSTVPGKSEVYLAPGMPLNEDSALFAAAYEPPGESDADRRRRDLACPFDRYYRKAADDPDHGAFFHSRYVDESGRAPAWRRVDSDWLEAASQLALNFDDHMNNTSLALAFELGENGPVLLFPGDAQVGNWLSWHELESHGGLTAQSLLNRTVLYKVGHHASHNATLKDMGLKMMTDTARLVAMIPVDEKEARKPKGRNKDGWAMPYDKLLADLQVRTEGRVLRADTGLAEPAEDALTSEQKKRWKRFKKELVVGKGSADGGDRILYIEHTVRP